MRISFSLYASPFGPRGGKLFFAASNAGLTDAAFIDGSVDFKRLLFSRHRVEATESNEEFKELFLLLDRYFKGMAVNFEMPIDLIGPIFSQCVWNELRKIPYGEVRTYGEIAEAVGSPGGARAVGNVCAKNPLPVVIPCHRVIAASGELGGYTAAYSSMSGKDIKKALLKLEGVEI